MEVVSSLSQGRTAAAQCGLFTHKSVPVIFEPNSICCIGVVNKCLLFLSGFKKNISTTLSTILRYRISYRSVRWQCRRSETTDRQDEARRRL